MPVYFRSSNRPRTFLFEPALKDMDIDNAEICLSVFPESDIGRIRIVPAAAVFSCLVECLYLMERAWRIMDP